MIRPTSFYVKTVLLLIVLALIVKGAADEYVQRKILSLIKANCQSCSVTISSLHIHFATSKVFIEDIHFMGGNRQTTLFDFTIPAMAIALDPTQLFEKVVYIQTLEITSPHVVIVEGDLKTPPISFNESSKWMFGIHQTSINQGDFTYIREHNGLEAKIHLDKIEIKLGHLGSTPELKDQRTPGSATALLERSGIVNISASSKIFQKSTNAVLDLNIRKFHLNEANGYFKVSDQITLSGHLLEGNGKVHINGGRLDTLVKATYEGLHVNFKKGEKRSATAAFFSNLITSLKMNKQNTSKPEMERVEGATINRTPDETLLTAIFRGLTEAAVKVTQ